MPETDGDEDNEFLSDEEIKEIEEIERGWKQEFRALPGFLSMYPNNMIFEEMGQGDTTPEILEYVVEHRERPYIEEILSDFEKLMPQIKSGKIDLDDFLYFAWTERMRDYEDKSDLEWLEDIQKMLRENYTKKYGKIA